jgi:hypothetical protein
MRERTGFGILVALLQLGILSDDLTRRSRIFQANSASNDAVLTAQVLDGQGSNIHEAADCAVIALRRLRPPAVISREQVT